MSAAVYSMYPEAFRQAAGFEFADERISAWWTKRVMAVASFVLLAEQPATWPDKRFPSAEQVRASTEASELSAAARELYIGYCGLLHDRYVAGEPIIGATYDFDSEAMFMVEDWLRSLDERMIGKLYKLTWAQAAEHAQKWHGAMAAKRVEGVAGNEGTGRRFEMTGGLYWVQLTSVDALKAEGRVMGHCVGDGAYDRYVRQDDDHDDGIWSLRDGDDKSILTLELVTHRFRAGGVIESVLQVIQVQGRGNRGTTEPERELVLSLAGPLGKPIKLGMGYDEWLDTQYVPNGPGGAEAYHAGRAGLWHRQMREAAAVEHVPQRLVGLPVFRQREVRARGRLHGRV